MITRYFCLWAVSALQWNLSSPGLIRNFFRMSTRPVATFTPIPILDALTQRDFTVLVQSGNEAAIKEVKKWKKNGKLDTNKVSDLQNQGQVMLLEKISSGEMVLSTTADMSKKSTILSSKVAGPPKPINPLINSNFNSYINIGNDEKPIYLKTTKQSVIDSYKSQRVDADYLVKMGYAFTNLTELFRSERIDHRSGSIAKKVREEHGMISNDDVWQRWTKKTNEYNTTSLTQVVAEYFKTESIGDAGGRTGEYVPKRGFPGTLAPGEKFIEDTPSELLPKEIMHPWPAMQEIPMHGRMPVTHPMIPPPVLWLGLNDMYTSDLVQAAEERLKAHPDAPVTGGVLMEAVDAIIIARNSKFGECYNLSEQLRHGGSIFHSGAKIPFYHPDHGPTVSDEEAKAPIPEELRPLIEMWYDPFAPENSRIGSMREIDIEELDSAAKEEEERRVKYEELIEEMSLESEWAAKEREEKQEMEDQIIDRFALKYEQEMGRMINLEANKPDSDEAEGNSNEVDVLSSPIESGKKRGAKKSSATALEIDLDQVDLDSMQIGNDTDYKASQAPTMVTDSRSDRPYANLYKPEVWLDKAYKEIELEREALDAFGEVRDRRQLMRYEVQFMRMIQEEGREYESYSQINLSTKKKNSRRKKTRKVVEDSDQALVVGDDTLDPDAVDTEFLTGLEDDVDTGGSQSVDEVTVLPIDGELDDDADGDGDEDDDRYAEDEDEYDASVDDDALIELDAESDD